MEERTWRRGQKADYTDRPLTEEERAFAADEKNYNLLFGFMRGNRLNPEEWYDILIIPYLNAVKKYCSRPELQIYAFSTILNNVLTTAVYNHYRAMHRKKRMPEGGLVSLDYTLEGDNPFAENTIAEWWIDKKTSVEKQVILKELFKEFYKKCIQYEDTELYGEDEVCEYLKRELDFLLKGYTHKQVNRKTEKMFPYGYDVDDLERDIERFRRIFKQVFGI